MICRLMRTLTFEVDASLNDRMTISWDIDYLKHALASGGEVFANEQPMA